MIDTNIFVFLVNDLSQLSKDVESIIQDYSNTLHISAESVKEPSDHVIISHAITNKLPLISSDHRFPYYTEQGLDLIFNKR